MIPVVINSQPDDETCGPTSLHAIYRYYNYNISHEQVISEVERSVSGGTLAPFLGKHALQHGFNSIIYINNLRLFDPTWFEAQINPTAYLIEKLRKHRTYHHDEGLLQDSKAYEEYLLAGGTLGFPTLNRRLLRKFFKQNIPILTGLNATYLYKTERERFTDEGKSVFDDMQGTPCGHFVVLCGHESSERSVVVADPHRKNPISHDNYYEVPISRLINAILLGVYTFDANLLIIYPKELNVKTPTKMELLQWSLG